MRSISVLNDLWYLSKYMHSRVVGLRLEHSLGFSIGLWTVKFSSFLVHI